MMNFEENIKYLEDRGYKKSMNYALNEDQWTKSDIVITVFSVRRCSLGYLKAIVKQKEQFDFSDPTY